MRRGVRMNNLEGRMSAMRARRAAPNRHKSLEIPLVYLRDWKA
jgi:hypothetical protein